MEKIVRSPQEVDRLTAVMIKDKDVMKVWSFWKQKYYPILDEDDAESLLGIALMKACRRHDFSQQAFHSTFVIYAGWEFNKELRKILTNNKLATFSTLNPNTIIPEKTEQSEESKEKFALISNWAVKYLNKEVRSIIDRIYLKGYTITQVAQEDSCSESSVSGKLTYGINKLREIANKGIENA